ncbi:hypothetical protein RRG08_050754 [Elysia crispata]|uniref:Uncharacterized protein n=1 Tax=Elysia crispata TaxID=231223 RepID=A0AAE0ZRI1_9GAST|nr:hypothetical protein RRG08_050754 [Elysia crispata]
MVLEQLPTVTNPRETNPILDLTETEDEDTREDNQGEVLPTVTEKDSADGLTAIRTYFMQKNVHREPLVKFQAAIQEQK